MNKLILSFFIILLFASCKKENNKSYIDNYYQFVYLAQEAFYESDHQKAFDLISKAEDNCKLLNQSLIQETSLYAISAAKLGKDEKALELIKQLILKGYDIHQLKKNEAFSNLLKTNEWKALENNYESLHQEYLNSIHIDIREQINEMTKADQFHRNRLNHDNENQDSIWQIINKTDSINDIKLKKIIEEYGYPNEDLIGRYYTDQVNIDPDILLFHFDDYDYYVRTLAKLIDKGNAPPMSLASFVDSYQRRAKGPKRFIYGIYSNSGSHDIIEYDKLDERRVAIGLSPMALKHRIDSLKRVYYNF